MNTRVPQGWDCMYVVLNPTSVDTILYKVMNGIFGIAALKLYIMKKVLHPVALLGQDHILRVSTFGVQDAI